MTHHSNRGTVLKIDWIRGWEVGGGEHMYGVGVIRQPLAAAGCGQVVWRETHGLNVVSGCDLFIIYLLQAYIPDTESVIGGAGNVAHTPADWVRGNACAVYPPN